MNVCPANNKTAMKIGLVIYGSLDTRSGGYLYDRKLVTYLRSQGDEVTLYALPWRGYPRHLTHNFWRNWADKLARAPHDILIQDELAHPSLFLLNRRLRKRANAPIISLVHHLRSDESHPQPAASLYRAIEARYLRTVDGLICNSEATLTATQALSGINLPAMVAHPGRKTQPPELSDEAIVGRAATPGPLRLLFVGNIIPRKGLHTLLDALALLPVGAARLSIIGDERVDANYSRRVRRQAIRLGLNAAVSWEGPVSDSELAERYRQRHVLAVPSRHEGFGIVYLEAMAYGMVAVGTASGGAAEIISPHETGFLIPKNDAETLAARLLWLHQHRPQMGKMGVAARRAWLKRPTWEQSGQKVRHFLIRTSRNQKG